MITLHRKKKYFFIEGCNIKKGRPLYLFFYQLPSKVTLIKVVLSKHYDNPQYIQIEDKTNL